MNGLFLRTQMLSFSWARLFVDLFAYNEHRIEVLQQNGARRVRRNPAGAFGLRMSWSERARWSGKELRARPSVVQGNVSDSRPRYRPHPARKKLAEDCLGRFNDSAKIVLLHRHARIAHANAAVFAWAPK